VNRCAAATRTPLLIQEGWRAERRGGYSLESVTQVAISTTPAPGATPPQLTRGAIFLMACAMGHTVAPGRAWNTF
jgi:hypothetical protein